MAISKRWAGRAFGTNIGNLFVSLEGEDSALSGTLRLLDIEYGISIFTITAKFDGTRLELTGEPQNSTAERPLSALTATGLLSPKGVLNGDWKTASGTAGTFILHPHDAPEISTEAAASDANAIQLYTARYSFGAIEINRQDVTAIASEIQQEFAIGRVVITFAAGTETSMFLDHFKTANLKTDRADTIKIFVQQPEPEGVNRTLSVELGPNGNIAMVQSSDQAWAFGKLETLKRDLSRYERTYATNFKKYGVGINQLLLAWVVIFVPSLPEVWKRAVLVVVVVALIAGMHRLHLKYLPLAAIYLSQKQQGALARFGPAVGSWFAAILSATIIFLVSEYLRRLIPT